MKPAIFKDAEIQARFNRDGFVVIDFITPAEANLIAEKFYKIHPNIPEGFYCDASNPDYSLKQDIYNHVEKSLEQPVAVKFCGYKKLGGTFLCKAPGQAGKVGLHQDWTIVDESKYYSVVIWIPTVDVDQHNGALRVIPGSHLFFDAYRSSSIEVSYRGNEQLLWENMITVPMKAGQAFVINNAVIHGSSPNLTDKERLAVTYALASKDAPLMYYHKHGSTEHSKVEKFSMPDDFFQRYYNIGQRPLFGEVVDVFDYSVPAVSTLKLRKLLELVKSKGDNFGEESVANFNRQFIEAPGESVVVGTANTENHYAESATWVDKRGFFERYTAANIFVEIKKRLFKTT